MLGVSRGTLRTALQRLEQTGEIVRRQGSGTFVGHVAMPTAFDEGLERLESYSSLARGRGVELTVRGLSIERVALRADLARVFDVAPETLAPRFWRIVLTNGEPAGIMTDIVHPDIELGPDAGLARAIEGGDMLLDVLLAHNVPIAWSDTRVRPRLITPREHAGKALGVRRTTAALELEEVMHVTSGEAVQHSRDLFAPGGLDLHVVRWLDRAAPAQVSAAAR